MYPFTKRLFDICLAATALLCSAPLLVVIAIAVRLAHGRPILFAQVRPGLHCQPFTMYKFRTMTSATDASGELLADSERLTRLGRLLRTTSLDELPELWNILKGQMSFVGPRPLLMEYLDRYTPQQMRRHDVKPGLSGLAQVSGRNAVSWEDRFAIDVEYVDTASFVLDLKILGRTAAAVVRRDGISQEGHATMQEFEG